MKEQELIDAFALVYKEDNYPPIAGKVLGYFYVSNKKHHTFEEIMDGIKASKSATSKALKFLIDLEEVTFKFSEKNKRKRLFFPNYGGTKKRLEKIIIAHETETILLKKVLKRRNSDTIEMNTLIQNIIAFNEDILDFISGKVDEHFKNE
ncbi:hypothetical protein [Dokdonia sp.]|uniref:hypothetical protein n=1 Tax=Dokdonia sp. TaxID=2024995 RepID=UPI0032672A7D